MSDDDDFVPPAEELDDGVEAVEHSVQRRQSKRAKTQPKSYAEGKRGSYKLTNEQLLADIAATKRLRGSKALTTNEALIVIHAYQRLKLKRQTPSKGRPSKTPLKEEVADLMGYSPATVGKVIANWNRLKQANGGEPPTAFEVTNKRGGTTRGRIPQTLEVEAKVRDYITSHWASLTQVTVVDVTKFLERQNIISIGLNPISGTYDQTAWRAAYRVVCNFVNKRGYLRAADGETGGKSDGTPSHPKEVFEYLRRMAFNSSLKNKGLRVVFQDESYIQSTHNALGQSLFHPVHNKGVTKKLPKKGQRLCFALAMQGPDPRADQTRPLAAHEKAGIILETNWIFNPALASSQERRERTQATRAARARAGEQRQQQQQQQQQEEEQQQQQQQQQDAQHASDDDHQSTSAQPAHGRGRGRGGGRGRGRERGRGRGSHSSAGQRTARNKRKSKYNDPVMGDYHKAFNGQNFLHWFEQRLLPALKQPSLIVLDNASYHKVFARHMVPVSQMRKAELLHLLCSPAASDLDELFSTFNEANPPDYEEEHRSTWRVPEASADMGVDGLRQLAKEWVANNAVPIVMRMAWERGHDVVFSPPRYSDLNPIELVWAFLKNHIAKEYDDKTTLGHVHERLKARMHRLSLDTGDLRSDGRTLCQAFIDKCDKECDKHRERLRKSGTAHAETPLQFEERLNQEQAAVRETTDAVTHALEAEETLRPSSQSLLPPPPPPPPPPPLPAATRHSPQAPSSASSAATTAPLQDDFSERVMRLTADPTLHTSTATHGAPPAAVDSMTAVVNYLSRIAVATPDVGESHEDDNDDNQET